MKLLSNKKIVMFDFDGTIVDSMETFAQIASSVINRIYGTPILQAREQYIKTSGLPFFQQLEQIHPQDTRNKEAERLYEEEKRRSYFTQPVYQQATKTIRCLGEQGYITAVSSNNFQELVDEFIRRQELIFDYVLGFIKPNFGKGKPHFERLLELTGDTKENMVFIGDSIKDAQIAAEFDTDFIGKTGFFSKSDFERHFPGTPVIEKLEELII